MTTPFPTISYPTLSPGKWYAEYYERFLYFLILKFFVVPPCKYINTVVLKWMSFFRKSKRFVEYVKNIKSYIRIDK